MSGGCWISEDRAGPLKVWKRPVSGKLYALGADPCEGRSARGDNACAQVLSVDNWEQVACWCARVDPDEFAVEIARLGRWYGEAFIVLEEMGGGQEVQRLLTQMGYFNRYRRREWDRIGNAWTMKWDWRSNTKTRPLMVAGLKAAIRTRRLVLHDVETIEELLGWTKRESARGTFKEGPADFDGHDDRVTGLGLAVQGVMLDSADDDDDDDMDDGASPGQRKGRWRRNHAGVMVPDEGSDDGLGDHWS